MLLPVLDESPLALISGALAVAFDDLIGWFCGWCFVQLFDESGMSSWPMLSLGVQRSRISALPHVPLHALVHASNHATLTPRFGGQSASFRSSSSNAISFGDGSADFATSFTRLSSRS